MFNINTATKARLESLIRPYIVSLPPYFVISRYSQGRIKYIKKLNEEKLPEIYHPPENFQRKLWGITFRSLIMNAAGMFKNGEWYEHSYRQGAGAYLGGTSTINFRSGNNGQGILQPFVPYPKSHSSSNFLGLPNDGDFINSHRLEQFNRFESFPIGWSLSVASNLHKFDYLKLFIASLKIFANAGVDFIEINESCPNISHKNDKINLEYRLNYIKENFLDQRTRNLPAIIKFSNDTKVEQIPEILDLLFKLGYDGVNFGNTSTNYLEVRKKIHRSERKLFDFFTQTFGGGISGRPLKEKSLDLCSRAVEYAKAEAPSQEFHVIRTGGIESMKDIRESEKAGISLNQWFTGYWENIAKYGHNIYREFFKS